MEGSPSAAGDPARYPRYKTTGIPVDEIGAPAVLADLVAYQEGSIVSKTLIKQKTGTITLFAFDKEQELSEHTAPYDAMVFVLDGVAEILIAGTRHNVGAGEMIIMPAQVPHALKANERFKMMLTMIRS